MRGKRILINPIDDYIGGDFIMANIKDEAMKYGKSGTIEYKMPEKMARELLKARKGEEAKMRPNDYLCKVVNENFGLKGCCVKVIRN